MAKQTKTEPSLYHLKRALVAKCLQDPRFKERFMKNAKEAIEQELNIKMPANVQITVVEDAENQLFISLPSKNYELSEEELESIAGGAEPYGDYLRRFGKWAQGGEQGDAPVWDRGPPKE